MNWVALECLITDVQSGFASGARDAAGTLQIRMNNVTTDGSLDWTNQTRVPATPSEIAKFSLVPGDVLLNSTNSPELVGKTTLFTGHAEPVVFSNHFFRLKVDESRLAPSYLARWFTHQWRRQVFQHLATQWVNQAAVRKEDILALEIPLPSLPEQRRIAAILDKADRLRRLRRFALQLSDSYLQSVFLQMFGDPETNPMGWAVLKFSQVCDTRLGKMLDIKRQTHLEKRPYLRNVNVHWGRIDISDIFEMGFTNEERRELRLRKGDVLICEGGEVGRTAIWNDQLSECYFQKALHRARPDVNRATPGYIAIMMSVLARSDGFRDFTSEVTIAHLTGEKLAELPVPLPPLSVQQAFGQLTEKFERLRAQQREAARQADHLFHTLLQQAFQSGLASPPVAVTATLPAVVAPPANGGPLRHGNPPVEEPYQARLPFT